MCTLGNHRLLLFLHEELLEVVLVVIRELGEVNIRVHDWVRVVDGSL